MNTKEKAVQERFTAKIHQNKWEKEKHQNYTKTKNYILTQEFFSSFSGISQTKINTIIKRYMDICESSPNESPYFCTLLFAGTVLILDKRKIS